MSVEVKIETLKYRIQKAEGRGNATAGVIRKWKRQIRNLTK